MVQQHIGGPSGRWFIILSCLLALVFEAIPMPSAWQPHWLLLVVFYWLSFLPFRMQLVWLWVLGLLWDVIAGNLLGLHAISLSLIAYIALQLQHRLRVSSMGQLAIYLSLFVALDLMVSLWILKFTQPVGVAANIPVSYWLPILTTLLMWPVVYTLLQHARYAFKVS